MSYKPGSILKALKEAQTERRRITVDSSLLISESNSDLDTPINMVKTNNNNNNSERRKDGKKKKDVSQQAPSLMSTPVTGDENVSMADMITGIDQPNYEKVPASVSQAVKSADFSLYSDNIETEVGDLIHLQDSDSAHSLAPRVTKSSKMPKEFQDYAIGAVYDTYLDREDIIHQLNYLSTLLPLASLDPFMGMFIPKDVNNRMDSEYVYLGLMSFAHGITAASTVSALSDHKAVIDTLSTIRTHVDAISAERRSWNDAMAALKIEVDDSTKKMRTTLELFDKLLLSHHTGAKHTKVQPVHRIPDPGASVSGTHKAHDPIKFMVNNRVEFSVFTREGQTEIEISGKDSKKTGNFYRILYGIVKSMKLCELEKLRAKTILLDPAEMQEFEENPSFPNILKRVTKC